ncbi:MAG: outer membrane beta-barrel protein [Crocinitomicaceae bacterium]|nr:outer membrane beta-barrel protein [Crocinitomicaceae bacterium]
MKLKRTLILLLLIVMNKAYAQEGFQLGLEASPAWHANMQRNKITGLRTSTGGYGFNVGVPVKWWFSDGIALQTGLTFELMLFDERINKNLISSNRHGSLHLPVMLNYALSGNWYLLFGGGVNYNVLNQRWTTIGKANLTAVTNTFQPYIGVGISTLMEREGGVFELGAQSRFHFIDLYKPSIFSDGDFTNRILSFDLILRYYLLNR